MTECDIDQFSSGFTGGEEAKVFSFSLFKQARHPCRYLVGTLLAVIHSSAVPTR